MRSSSTPIRVLLAALLLIATAGVASAQETEAQQRAQWRRAFDQAGADYRLADEAGKEKRTLIEQPTYTWARSGPQGGNYGAVYVWTARGNAEAVACFWRNPHAEGSADLVHELHSLSAGILQSTGKDSDSWKPKAGLKRHLLPDAPAPAKTASARMQQMRAFGRDFTARSVSSADERTQLRLLPQPLYRYESTDDEVVDGALFAFVCSIGTDPEIFLLLEARDTADGPKWHYAAARFSHMDLFVDYKDREVWQARRDRENTLKYNADHTYWVFHTRMEETK